jgi:hypothetical protein
MQNTSVPEILIPSQRLPSDTATLQAILLAGKLDRLPVPRRAQEVDLETEMVSSILFKRKDQPTQSPDEQPVSVQSHIDKEVQ